ALGEVLHDVAQLARPRLAVDVVGIEDGRHPGQGTARDRGRRGCRHRTGRGALGLGRGRPTGRRSGHDGRTAGGGGTPESGNEGGEDGEEGKRFAAVSHHPKHIIAGRPGRAERAPWERVTREDSATAAAWSSSWSAPRAAARPRAAWPRGSDAEWSRAEATAAGTEARRPAEPASRPRWESDAA